MAKKIRFPLEMENGIEVRSLEELKDNFSLVRVLGYVNDGKLVVWLRDRYANDIADAVEALDKKDQELARKISEIFEIPYDEKLETNLEKVSERIERFKKLKEITDEARFLDEIDNVAFDQNELYDLLDEGNTEIYLCGDSFEIPIAKRGVHYIGVNNPVVVVVSKTVVDWNAQDIQIESVQFDEKYQKILDEKAKEDAKKNKANDLFELFKEMKFKEFLERFNEDEADDEAYYMAYRIYLTGNIDVPVNEAKGNSYLAEGYEKKFPICSVAYTRMANWSDDKKIAEYNQFKPQLQQMSDRGNILATHELGVCYINNTNEKKDYVKALEYFMKNMEQDYFWLSAFSIGLRYHDGQGVKRDYKIATDYYYHALKYGHIWAYVYTIDLYSACIDGSELKLEKAREAFYKAAGLNAGKEVLNRYVHNRMWFYKFDPSSSFSNVGPKLFWPTYSSRSQAINEFSSAQNEYTDDGNRKFLEEVDSYMESFLKLLMKKCDLICAEVDYCKQAKVSKKCENTTLETDKIGSMMKNSPSFKPCTGSQYYELEDMQYNGLFGGHEITLNSRNCNYSDQWASRCEYVQKNMPKLYDRYVTNLIWDIIDQNWVDATV